MTHRGLLRVAGPLLDKATDVSEGTDHLLDQLLPEPVLDALAAAHGASVAAAHILAGAIDLAKKLERGEPS